MPPRAPKGRFILLFERFLKGSKKGQFFDAHSERSKIDPDRPLCQKGSPPKNENTTFVAYKAPKIKAPRPAPNYQRNTRKKGLNIRKKILTRLWAFGPANLLIYCKGLTADAADPEDGLVLFIGMHSRAERRDDLLAKLSDKPRARKCDDYLEPYSQSVVRYHDFPTHSHPTIQ